MIIPVSYTPSEALRSLFNPLNFGTRSVYPKNSTRRLARPATEASLISWQTASSKQKLSSSRQTHNTQRKHTRTNTAHGYQEIRWTSPEVNASQRRCATASLTGRVAPAADQNTTALNHNLGDRFNGRLYEEEERDGPRAAVRTGHTLMGAHRWRSKRGKAGERPAHIKKQRIETPHHTGGRQPHAHNNLRGIRTEELESTRGTRARA